MNDPGTTAAPVTAPAQERKKKGRGATSDAEPQLYGLLAEFETPAAIMAAAEKVRDAGYRWWDCHTPFFIHGLDDAMGVKRTILPFLVFGCGFTGAMIGFILQWYTNAVSFDAWLLVPITGYDYLVSGKPAFSLAVYVIVMFELTVLLSAVGAVFLMLGLNKLPWLYHPCFKSERFMRATDDRFFIVIEAGDPLFYLEKTEEFLRSLGADAIEPLEA